MVECGSAGMWDRGIKGMCNGFMGSGVYCLFTVSTMVECRGTILTILIIKLLKKWF
jgi:hypothetical protein